VYYEVYVDVLFAKNLWLDGLLLLLTAWAGKMPVKGGRIAAAACLGSVGTCVLTIASAQFDKAGYLAGTFLVSAVMIGVAFGIRENFRINLLFLYTESFFVAGILRFLEQMQGFSEFYLLLFASGAAAVFGIADRRIRSGRRKAELVYPVILCCGNSRIQTEAYYDTGNSLCDPISGRPVSILSAALLDEVLDNANRELLPRMIPYHTISQNGILKAYTLDSMEIRCPRGGRIIEKPMVAVMPGESGQYQLILHRDLLPG
jgi:stage II sporulation protein GA (sporulation sigma-E factor processing peptidase)